MNKTLYGAVAAVSLLIAAPAFADHNSLWGEGTAVDAQGVHGDRYDTLAAGGEMSGFKAGTVEIGTAPDIEPRQSAPDTVDAADSASDGGSDGGQDSDSGGGSGGGAGGKGGR